MEKIYRCFLWGGTDEKNKICWVNWDTVMASKEKCGLGVGSLRSLNLALLFKWIWQLKSEQPYFWIHVISSIHNLARKPVDKLAKLLIPGTWGNIIKTVHDLGKIDIKLGHVIKFKVGCGSKTFFWLDD